MDPIREYMTAQSRRHFFMKGALGLGVPALASMVPGLSRPSQALAAGQSGAASGPETPEEIADAMLKMAPKAKRAIYLFMAGAPAQMDTFDYSPVMTANPEKFHGKDIYDFVERKYRITTMTSKQKKFPIAHSRYAFRQGGQSGAWVSDLLPYTRSMVDDLAIVKSVHTEAINHDPAITYICTGHQLPGRASLGSWLSYGLGSENENLPGFVVMTPTWTGRKQAQALYNRLWGSGFLPSKYQGVSLRRSGDPVLFLSNPDGVDPATRRRMLDSLGQLNQKTFDSYADPETQARIAQYEMAFRMQTSVPELTDLKSESKATLDMYGPDVHKSGTFAHSAILARRMAERGVRFVQIFHRGWDQHGGIAKDLPNQCRDVDQPSWALIQDLKQRGLLDDTLVIWGGEFGRTIYGQGNFASGGYGRDHHPGCFSIWMAGGGIQGGKVYGETDDFSYSIVKDPVHIRDLNATILHQMGIDHERFTYKFQGLDQRLTGVEEAHVIKDILA